MSTYLGFQPTLKDDYIFLSYNTEDASVIGPIVRWLDNAGIPIWYDHGIATGEQWRTEIAKHIQNCRAVLIFITRAIYLKEKSYVYKEYEMGREFFSKPVYVVMLDKIEKSEIPPHLLDWWIDLTHEQCIEGWKYDELSLCNEIKKLFVSHDERIPEIILKNTATKEEYLIQKGITQIGRDGVGDHEIFLNDELISRKHALIEWDEGVVSFTDLLAKNGSFINGKSIYGTRKQLENGDHIVLGKTSLQIIFRYINEAVKQENSTLKVGDSITFGSYPQSADASKGKSPIEWTVLAVKDGKALLISRYALAVKPFHNRREGTTWEACTLRKWLNEDFLNAAFEKEELKRIIKNICPAHMNPQCHTKAGNNTEDKVFLLSILEAEKYFGSNSGRKAAATAYVWGKDKFIDADFKTTSGNWWWLRSPGGDQDYAAFVGVGGSVIYGGGSVCYGHGCVRPAMWINLDS